jgi:hypothetical protein
VVPEHIRFGGGPTETLLHPAVLVVLIVAVLAVLALPRKYVVVPFLMSAFLIPGGQGIYFAGLHIFVLRIILLFAWMRLAYLKLLSRSNLVSGSFNSIDKSFTLWAICHSIAFILLYREMGAVINQASFLWDVFTAYFLLRFLIQDEEDIRRVIKVLAVIAAVVAVSMVNEKLRDQNWFGFLIGVPIVPLFREGAIRAQGPFAVSILAGAFGATLLPLFFWLWYGGKSRLLAVAGMAAATIITLTSASSTPMLAYAAGILAVFMWPVRRKMRAIRWGMVIGLVTLHLIMKAPVWFLINHIDLVAGNSGYHRALLIDQFVKHFFDWWLVGTASSPSWGIDMWDTSNAYVQEGILGGLLGFIFFIAVISRSFARLGTARKAVDDDPKKQWFIWFLGAALFAHIVGYFGVTYFDNTQIAWFTLLAIISAATLPILATKTSPALQGDMALNDPLTDAYPPPSSPPREAVVSQMGHVNSRFAPAPPFPGQQTSDVFSYKQARPFRPRSSHAGKLDKQ